MSDFAIVLLVFGCVFAYWSKGVAGCPACTPQVEGQKEDDGE